jgi:penicillin-binding protein 1A
MLQLLQHIKFFILEILKTLFFFTPVNWRYFYRKMNWAGKVASLVNCFLFLIAFFFISVEINFLGMYGRMPDAYAPESQIAVTSEMYSADGTLIAKYYTENRTPVAFKEISPHVIDCLIATEDIRFYQHKGIDFTALFSALWSTTVGDKQRGGSTITQQLVKNLFNTRKSTDGWLSYISFLRTPNHKIKEWLMAVRIEKRYSKQDILTMYLNTVDFGNNAFGIRTAAHAYFNALPDQLTLTESALLIGILKGTTVYNPLKREKRALERRNVVLGQLLKYNKINKADYQKLLRMPIGLRVPARESVGNIAPYFRNVAGNFLEDWCKKNKYNLYTDGLKIYTTLDTRMQAHAEAAMMEHMRVMQERFNLHWKYAYQDIFASFRRKDSLKDKFPHDWFLVEMLQKSEKYKDYIQQNKHLPFQLYDSLQNGKRKMHVFTWQGVQDSLISPIDSVRHHLQILQAGMMTVNPYTGQVKAWVGGIDFDSFAFDHVMQSKRQPGSTFKPIVYAEAFEQGKKPCDVELDAPVTIQYTENGERKTWSPSNSDFEYLGNITLRKAMGTSKNSVTARLTEKVTPEAVVKRAKLLGITSEMKAVPSVGLGSNLVSLYEMVGVYCAIQNQGEWIEPYFITEIKDRNGKTIYKAKPNKRPTMSKRTAFLMTDMLRAGVQEQGGTSQALWEYPELFAQENEIGGKTGTSSNYADGWYIGVTNSLVTGVWLGADDHRIHFHSPELGEASQTALPLYGKYMTRLYNDTDLDVKRGKYPDMPPELQDSLVRNRDYGCLTPYARKRDNVPVDSKDE